MEEKVCFHQQNALMCVLPRSMEQGVYLSQIHAFIMNLLLLPVKSSRNFLPAFSASG